MKKALIIFTRIPLESKTKTRLMPYYTGKQCVGLHIAMLRDLAEKLLKLKNTGIYVFYTPNGDISVLKNIFGNSVKFMLQTGKNLGEKMYSAINQILEISEKVVLIGSDIPEVNEKDIEEAFKILETKDIVLAGTTDGGYYLVGMKEACRDIFNVEYGNSSVFERTKNKIKSLELRLGIASTHIDIDTKEDIKYYYEKLRTDKNFRNTHAGRFLANNKKIAIIVPIYNEEETIENIQFQLEKARDRCEIIFVDGGSTDRTLKLLDTSKFRLLQSKKGRNNQMNLGAENVSEDVDILFFLHCDSTLPVNFINDIIYVSERYSAGCFGIAFKSLSPLMFICRYISNHRVFDRKVMFGDQGIIVDKDLFMKVGMFPDLPIMEDYQFSLTLKECGIKLGMARHRIHTSPRRFKGGFIRKLRLMWKMNRLRKMYRDGIDINKIADMYKDVR